MSAVSLRTVCMAANKTAPYSLGSIDKYYNSASVAFIEYTIPSGPKTLSFLRDKALRYSFLQTDMPSNFISRYGTTSYACLIHRLVVVSISSVNYINLYFTVTSNGSQGDILVPDGSLLEANDVALTLNGIAVGAENTNAAGDIVKRTGYLQYSYPSGSVSDLSFRYSNSTSYGRAVIPFLQFRIIATALNW